MKIYRINRMIVKEPMDAGFPDRQSGIVICKKGETLQDAICRRFSVESIYNFDASKVEEIKDLYSINLEEISVGDLVDIIS